MEADVLHHRGPFPGGLGRGEGQEVREEHGHLDREEGQRNGL